MTDWNKTTEGSNDYHQYDDIIGLPHPVSANHPQMSRADRAAQFSPFAALTGYEDAIAETGRLTDNRIELEEDARIILDEKLRWIQEQISVRPEAAVTYFLPDSRKAGGSYVTLRGRVKKIDPYERVVVMQDGSRIQIEEIVEICLTEERD